VVAVTIKAIDPLGRMTRQTLVVDPVPPDQLRVTVPGWHTLDEVQNGDDMGLEIVSAADLGLQVAFVFLQREPGFEQDQVVAISPQAGSQVPVGSLVTVSVNLLG